MCADDLNERVYQLIQKFGLHSSGECKPLITEIKEILHCSSCCRSPEVWKNWDRFEVTEEIEQTAFQQTLDWCWRELSSIPVERTIWQFDTKLIDFTLRELIRAACTHSWTSLTFWQYCAIQNAQLLQSQAHNSGIICLFYCFLLRRIERQRTVTSIIGMMQQSGRIRRRAGLSDNYQEALQATWLWFCEHLCEYDLADSEELERATVFTWFNNRLRSRISALLRCRTRDEGRRVNPPNQESRESDPVEEISDVSSGSYSHLETDEIVERILDWVRQNGAMLRRMYVSGQPRINCAVLIRLRLPQRDEQSGQYSDPPEWSEIAQQLKVSEADIPSMRRCYGRCLKQLLPRLLQLLTEEGYFDP